MNNKGLSLAELLVALAVSAIVLTGAAYLLFTMLNFYGRTNANVELQNESQTAMNLIIDHIMDTEGLCMIETDIIPGPKDNMKNKACVLLGDLTIDKKNFKAEFTGEALIWEPDSKRVYLVSYDAAAGNQVLVSGGAASESEAASLAIKNALADFGNKTPEEKLPYLLADYVTVFDLRTAAYYQFPGARTEMDSKDPEKTIQVDCFREPVILSLHMEFEYEYQNDKYLTRTMDEDISVRNRIRSIYLQRKAQSGMPAVMRKYYLEQ